MLPCTELFFAAPTRLQLDLEHNEIGGHYDPKQGKVIYTPEGPKAIADALLGNAFMTSLDVSFNRLGEEGVKLLEDAVREREGFKLNARNK